MALSVSPVVLAAGADDDVPLSFTRLDLSDGRKLRNVVVKSYDAKSQKLLVIADGRAMTFPVALLPPPFNEQLKRAPASGGSVSTLTLPPRPIATAADQYTLERPMPIRPAHVTPSPARPVSAPIEDPTRLVAKHEGAARNRAARYYTFEHPVGSSSVKVTLLDVEIESTKPVPGWEGRFETQGKAFLEYYDSKGRSFQRATSAFEIVTEQKSGESLQVVDVRIKR